MWIYIPLRKFTKSVKILFPMRKMVDHPGKLLAEYLDQYWWTQKAFALHVWKRVSEINELIKGKRNITIAWDIIFTQVFQTPQKFWIFKQIDYEYQQVLEKEKISLSILEQGVSKQKEIQEPTKESDQNSSVSEEKEEHFPAEVPQEFLITKVFESF